MASTKLPTRFYRELLRFATTCKCISNSLEDYEVLTSLLAILMKEEENFCGPKGNRITSKFSLDIETISRVSSDCENIWTVMTGIDWLLFYIFSRRYGLEDVSKHDPIQAFVPSAEQRFRKTNHDDEGRYQARITKATNELIDLLEQASFNLTNLRMFTSAIGIASNTPFTRHQLIIHTLRWALNGMVAKSGTNSRLSIHGGVSQPILPEDATRETMFNGMLDLVVRCTTDKVYATRVAVIAPLSKLFAQLSINSAVRLTECLIDRARKKEINYWEGIEGCLNALGLLLRRVRPPSSISEEELKGGDSQLSEQSSNPDFLSQELYQSCLLPMVQNLVADLFEHETPSVRTAAVKLYVTFIKRCTFNTILDALDDAILVLCGTEENNSVGRKVNKPGFHVTECLLSVCQVCIKKYGPIKLPTLTGDLQNALLDRFIGHPNPNVNQASVLMYQTLINSATVNVKRVCYLMLKLVHDWSIHPEVLEKPLEAILKDVVIGYPSTQSKLTPAWCSGRLKILQEVFYNIIQQHLIIVYELFEMSMEEIAQHSPEANKVMTPKSPVVHKSNEFDFRPTRISQNSTDFDKSLGRLSVISESGFSGGARESKFDISKSIIYQIQAEDKSEKRKSTIPSISWGAQLIRRMSSGSRRQSYIVEAEQTADSGDTKMYQLLHTITNATLECMLFPSKSLRKQARLTFTELCRLINWLDFDLLSKLLSNTLSLPPTLKSFGTIKILRSSLAEFDLYTRIYLIKENPVMSIEDLTRRKLAGILDFGVFNPRSAETIFNEPISKLWLEQCMHYVIDPRVPMCLTVPAIDCILYALSLTHVLPELNEHANKIQTALSTQHRKIAPIQLKINESKVMEAVHATVRFIQRYKLKIDSEENPKLASPDPVKLGPLNIRTSSKENEKSKPSGSNIFPIILRFVDTLEQTLFQLLPPIPKPNWPSIETRYIAGHLLAPLLPTLVSWTPMIIPPLKVTAFRTSLHVSRYAKVRLLAMRKLLRVVASIVLSLQPADSNATRFVSMPSQSDLTEAANGYILEVTTVLEHYEKACQPAVFCKTSCWWYIRGLCEHLPRLLQVAPHATPVNLMCRLLNEAIRTQSLSSRKSNSAKSEKYRSLWHKAIMYAIRVAKNNKPKKEKDAFLWPTVGQHGNENLRKRSMSSLVEPVVGKEELDRWQNPYPVEEAFDDLTETDDNIVLNRAPVQTSSEEDEAEMEISEGGRLLPKGKPRFISTANAEVIETPPPFDDLISLLKRICSYCQPVAIEILKNMVPKDQMKLIEP